MYRDLRVSEIKIDRRPHTLTVIRVHYSANFETSNLSCRVETNESDETWPLNWNTETTICVFESYVFSSLLR